jgi:hypothetical protein
MRIDLAPIKPFRHDLGHCLHATAGTLLAFHGIDPVHALGAAWSFRYPGDLRREEYYLPGHAEDLFAGLAPYHDISSRWHTADEPAEGWRVVRGMLASGVPVAVAADNFFLPFRPAYRDVHSNHLLLLYGFDDDAGHVYVVDPVPPSYQGPIPLETLSLARGSVNPVRHDRDMFFTANPIANRWLTVRVGPVQPVMDRAFVARAIEANVAGFGLAGLRAFLAAALAKLPDDGTVIDEIFLVAGPLLAVTGLHAEFLDRAGQAFGVSALRELGRRVDRIAHHLSALRIAVASARHDRAAAVPGLRRRQRWLLEDCHRVLESMSQMSRLGGQL